MEKLVDVAQTETLELDQHVSESFAHVVGHVASIKGDSLFAGSEKIRDIESLQGVNFPLNHPRTHCAPTTQAGN